MSETFWSQWIDWWTSVSAQWNAIDQKIQAGEVVLTAPQQEAYAATKANFDRINAQITEIDADDLVELKAVSYAPELVEQSLQLVSDTLSSAFGWVDSLFD